MNKEEQIKEIMRRIDEIPVASASQIIQEKGLLFRLRRDWLRSVAEAIYSLIASAEQRGREKVKKVVNDLYAMRRVERIVTKEGHGGFPPIFYEELTFNDMEWHRFTKKLGLVKILGGYKLKTKKEDK